MGDLPEDESPQEFLDPLVIEEQAKEWIRQAVENNTNAEPEVTMERKLAFWMTGVAKLTNSGLLFMSGRDGLPPDVVMLYLTTLIEEAAPDITAAARSTVPDAFLRDADPNFTPGLEQ